ncbi:YabP/YqfC family sporulation protein [Caldicellulosiruptor naganoensis]|uniref:YabP/YqfC family sporulation protein n=1 Tax=Caldicellulosiruptor naganoensis TaxID=29324 RepID=A0ABY7BMP0_9FIRM|nr:YabP/YqfC family sporulation protein [Caldicellulosiruptor naganoensis]
MNGVDDVESFDENNIILVVDEELLIIKGFDLKINKINTETGERYL